LSQGPRLTLLWRIRVLIAGLGIPALLRLMTLDRLANRLGRPARGVKRPSVDQQAAITAAVDRLLERLPSPWRRTCLTRSLVLYHLLRRSGVPVELRIGVRRHQDAFTAHAWLTREGSAYLEEQTPPHEIIASFPG
jgi:hypothetical protein